MEEEGDMEREWGGGGGLNISGAEKMALEGRRGGERTNAEREEMERTMRREQWEGEGWGNEWMMTMEGMEKTLEGGKHGEGSDCVRQRGTRNQSLAREL